MKIEFGQSGEKRIRLVWFSVKCFEHLMASAIAGNSGRSVVNRAGEFAGIIFDGNLQGLPWDYAYSDKQGRYFRGFARDHLYLGQCLRR